MMNPANRRYSTSPVWVKSSPADSGWSTNMIVDRNKITLAAGHLVMMFALASYHDLSYWIEQDEVKDLIVDYRRDRRDGQIRDHVGILPLLKQKCLVIVKI